MVDKFTCEECGGTFDKNVTEEGANGEAQEIWGIKNASTNSNFAVICDDCFYRLFPKEAAKMEARRN